MPTYAYVCRRCNRQFDRTCGVDERNDQLCECGAKPERQWSSDYQVGGFKPRWVEIKGERVFVSTKSELVSACNQRGALHMGYSYFDREEGKDR